MVPFEIALRSSDFPVSERVDAFRDAAAAFCKLEFTVADPSAFRSQTRIAAGAEVLLGWSAHSRCVTERTGALAAAGSDNVMIHAAASGAFVMQQAGGDEVPCRPGLVYVDPNEVTGRAEYLASSTEVFYISLPRSRGARHEAALRRGLTQTPEWHLALGYGRMLLDRVGTLSPQAWALGCAHVAALVDTALAQEAPRSARAVTARRHAQLCAIKADIEAHLGDPALSPAMIARRHGMSERYLRSLFADEDTCFRDFVMERRLDKVALLLRDPAFRARSISDLALSVGFGDLSWFNHSYRRRFGQTPSDTRRLVPPAP